VIGTKRDKSVKEGYSYGAIERALAAVFAAETEGKKIRLRARLKHLARLGLPGVQPGKGQALTYTHTQATQLLIALLASEVGIPPVVTVRTIKKYWDKEMARWLGKAADPEAVLGNPLFLHIRPQLMTTWGSSKSPPLWIGVFQRWKPDLVRSHTITRGPEGTAGRIKINEPTQRIAENILDKIDHPDEWVCVRNLTHTLSIFESVLRKEESDGRS
jgi:hypothetical protein